MDLPYTFAIETLLAESQPRSILIVGSSDLRSIVSDYLEQVRFLRSQCGVTVMSHESVLDELPEHGRFDIAVVAGALEHMDKTAGRKLLAALRDVHAARFCAAVPVGREWAGMSSQWQPGDFFALGLTLLDKYATDDGSIHLYKYDIATYKKTPDWLNARDWANPEMWDKYRW